MFLSSSPDHHLQQGSKGKKYKWQQQGSALQAVTAQNLKRDQYVCMAKLAGQAERLEEMATQDKASMAMEVPCTPVIVMGFKTELESSLPKPYMDGLVSA